jgi:hypothetical protein
VGAPLCRRPESRLWISGRGLVVTGLTAFAVEPETTIP